MAPSCDQKTEKSNDYFNVSVGVVSELVAGLQGFSFCSRVVRCVFSYVQILLKFFVLCFLFKDVSLLLACLGLLLEK